MATTLSSQDKTEALLARSFARFDTVALGVGCGAALGLFLFLITARVVLSGAVIVNLGLLANYFPGYEISWLGSLEGLLYGFGVGFVGGWLFAFLHNTAIALFLYYLRFKVQLFSITDYVDIDHARP